LLLVRWWVEQCGLFLLLLLVTGRLMTCDSVILSHSVLIEKKVPLGRCRLLRVAAAAAVAETSFNHP